VTSFKAMHMSENQDREGARPATAAAGERESLAMLIREAVDGLVDLVAAHIKLTNLELVADLQARGRELAHGVAICVAALLGYAFALIAVALALTVLMSPALAFALVGGVHLLGAGIAALVLSRRRRRSALLERELESLGKSVNAVADAVLAPINQSHARN
jgi:hypothetical protein